MMRYIERQLNHQRQLLSLELPQILQTRSQSLNFRLKRILGMVDVAAEEHDIDRAASEMEEARRCLEGSTGDLMYSRSDGDEDSESDNDSQPFSKFLANAHIEMIQVDALPSPACDTAKFAVIYVTDTFSLNV